MKIQGARAGYDGAKRKKGSKVHIAVLYLIGFSLNTLSLFGLVLRSASSTTTPSSWSRMSSATCVSA